MLPSLSLLHAPTLSDQHLLPASPSTPHHVQKVMQPLWHADRVVHSAYDQALRDINAILHNTDATHRLFVRQSNPGPITSPSQPIGMVDIGFDHLTKQCSAFIPDGESAAITVNGRPLHLHPADSAHGGWVHLTHACTFVLIDANNVTHPVPADFFKAVSNHLSPMQLGFVL